MSGIKSGSKVKSNPYGPDWDGSEQAPTQDAIFDLINNLPTSSPSNAQFPRKISVNAESVFRILSGGVAGAAGATQAAGVGGAGGNGGQTSADL